MQNKHLSLLLFWVSRCCQSPQELPRGDTISLPTRLSLNLLNQTVHNARFVVQYLSTLPYTGCPGKFRVIRRRLYLEYQVADGYGCSPIGYTYLGPAYPHKNQPNSTSFARDIFSKLKKSFQAKHFKVKC